MPSRAPSRLGSASLPGASAGQESEPNKAFNPIAPEDARSWSTAALGFQMDDSEATDSEFDVDFARQLVGKYVLVGITIHDSQGEFKRQEQFHGTVISADAKSGIKVSLQGARKGEEECLPPATHVFEPAEPGVYKLRSTDEEVKDPDFTALWLLTEPDA